MVSITRQTLTDEIRRQQQLAQEITKGQIAVSSGKKYSAPSDNIQSWVQISEIGKMQASYSAWTGNIEYGQSRSRSEEHTSELQSLMRISYAVFCLKKKKTKTK